MFMIGLLCDVCEVICDAIYVMIGFVIDLLIQCGSKVAFMFLILFCEFGAKLMIVMVM